MKKSTRGPAAKNPKTSRAKAKPGLRNLTPSRTDQVKGGTAPKPWTKGGGSSVG